MNQTTWIIGGGVVIVALAGLLYSFSGVGAGTQSPLASTTEVNIQAVDIPLKQATSSLVTTTQSSNTKMEPITNKVTTAVMHTTMGDISFKLYTEESPKTVANFVKLAGEGFYNGVKFHRVIKDFMIQTGDPLSKDDSQTVRWGTGGTGHTFADEFNSHKLVRGSLAMANAGPNTNDSQFFIVTKDSTPWLDGKHTNFGEVTSGLDVVMKIGEVETLSGDRPVKPVIINSIDIK